jgi:NADPH2:quinone reductase
MMLKGLTVQYLIRRTYRVKSGEGVPVVYDSVGKDTFESSLKCLRPYELLASFGNASGRL